MFSWDTAVGCRLYTATTAFLGFKVQDSEYEVLGLAAMGTPKHASHLLDNVVALCVDGGFWVKPYFLDQHFQRPRKQSRIMRADTERRFWKRDEVVDPTIQRLCKGAQMLMSRQ